MAKHACCTLAVAAAVLHSGFAISAWACSEVDGCPSDKGVDGNVLDVEATGGDEANLLQLSLPTNGPSASPLNILQREAGAWAEKQYGLTVVSAYSLPHNATLYVATGSITDFTGDAMVDAANEPCLGGGGVDGVISRAGGAALLAARQKLPAVDGVRCPTGDAKIVPGGNLSTKFCILAVGPNYLSCDDVKACDRLLMSAYEESLQRAEEKKLSTVAFSLLSTGIFAGTQSTERLQEIGMQGIRNGAYAGLQDVYVIAYPAYRAPALERACQQAGLKPVGLHASTLSGLHTDPCPFGYGDGCGGGGQVDAATKAKVANILEGILKNLSNKKALVQGKKMMSKINQVDSTSHAGVAVMRSASVNEALKGLLARLRATSQQAEAVDALETLIAGGGDGEPIDPETKAKVAAILEGILKNLSSHR